MVIIRIILTVIGLLLTSIITWTWVRNGAPQGYEQVYSAVVLHFAALIAWYGLWATWDE